MSEKHYVYIISNKVTGRKYVGKSATPNYRFVQHMKMLKHHRHTEDVFQRDYDLYGGDVFEMRVLDAYEPREASRIEMFMMSVLRTKDPEYGYNCKDRTGIYVDAHRNPFPFDIFPTEKDCNTMHTKYKTLRDSLGLSDRQVAIRSGVPSSTIYDFEQRCANGENAKMSLKTVTKLARFFDVPIGYFAGD